MPELIIICVFLFVVAFVLLRGMKVIGLDEIGIVERLGAYLMTKEAGIHFMLPFVDRFIRLKKFKH
jgi:regulator of protease activity HflC (stomatin/prohibitin superfamily)